MSPISLALSPLVPLPSEIAPARLSPVSKDSSLTDLVGSEFQALLGKGHKMDTLLQDYLVGNGNIEQVAPVMADLAVEFEYATKLVNTALSAYKAVLNMAL
jgi:hypothetical protein